MSITIRGYSDDVIAVSGDIVDEFCPMEGEPHYLATSNGVVVRVEYVDPGIWRISPVINANHFPVRIELAPEYDDANYSDECVIEGSIEWAVLGLAIVIPSKVTPQTPQL